MKTALTRRRFLRTAGIALALPALDHFLPRGYAAAGTAKTRRMVTLNATLGLYPGYLWPTTPGRDFESTPYLDVLKDFRRDMTIFSGVSHPGLQAGHEAEPCFLSAAPMDRGGNFRNSISVDQFAAEKLAKATLLFDLTRLALQTDSTRVIAIQHPNTHFITSVPNLTTDWHNLTHHSNDPEKIAQLKLIELAHLGVIRDFLAKLKKTPDQGGTLLDTTSVLFGSHLGNAGKHDCKNLPMMLFGGGFKHAGHLAFDREHNTPAARIFVAMLQRLGIEADEFASGKGRIAGLELA